LPDSGSERTTTSSKPFSPLELSARVRAFLRRSRAVNPDDETIVVGRVRIGAHSGTVEVDGEPVALPALEFKLLRFLAENRGMAFTPAELYEKSGPTRRWGRRTRTTSGSTCGGCESA
jgi:DNA-binding response OmpR family regulator